ncbi:MAG TPA: Calx-beta domain-containing protein [Verrucomicrobiae bacterium]|nr:Calx-beta domain-containing protein [Verrucomicrobiae bacterium]
MKTCASFECRLSLSALPLATLMVCLAAPGATLAFSIANVTLTPTNPIPSGSNIIMTVDIATPGSPAWLYQPTKVAQSGNQIGVDLYPASGLLTAIGRISTNVSIGVLPAGVYEYEVRLHPDPDQPANWGVRTNRGMFMVMPDYPWTMVSITAPDSQATESGVTTVIDPGRFTVHRAGATNVDLWVHYAIGGTASNGVDYLSISNVVFIPAGRTSADILINASFDTLPEGRETVVLRLLEPVCPAIYPPPPDCYLVGTPREAIVYINDNTLSRPLVSIVARDAVATEGTNCYRWPGWPTPSTSNSLTGTNTATFVVMREGSTNESLTVFYSIGGTATNGVDYKLLPGHIVIPAGQRAAPIVIVPADDAIPEKIETIVLGLIEPPYASPLPSPYVVGKPARAAAIIVDNDQPRPCTERLPDRCFHLTQPGLNGDWYRIEYSTDLVNWTVICTNTVTDGALHFVDPDADEAAQRFYRAVPETNPELE